jgi:hypothetical protein
MNCRCSIAISLGLLFWLCLASADVIRLRSGESLDGTVVNETESTLSIAVERAGGTILSTETVNKDQITEIIRATPEQLAQQAMERAYANTQKYRLDPRASYTPSYYDQIIDGVLRKFLKDYPDSPYTNAVQAKLKEWLVEQGTVTSGLGRYNGTWMSAAEAAKRNAEAQLATVLDRGKMLLAQSQFAAAIEQFNFVATHAQAPGDQTEARQLSLDATRRWAETLERQRNSLAAEIKHSEDNLSKAQSALQAAEHRPSSVPSDVQRFGVDPYVIRGRADVKNAESRLAQLRDTASALDRQITDVRSRIGGAADTAKIASAGTTTKSAVTQSPESATAGTAVQRDVVEQVGDILRRYWVLAIVVVVAMLWLCVHIFTRD